MEGISLAVAVLSAGIGTYVCLPGKGGINIASPELLVRHLDDRLLRVADAPVLRKACKSISIKGIAGSLRRKLALNGIDLAQESCAAIVLLGAFAATIVGGLLSGSAVGAAVLGVIYLAVLPAWQASIARRERADLVQAMPQVFRTLSSALGSGKTLPQAIDFVGSHEKGRAAEEFARASLEIKCGIPISEALSDLSGRLDAPGVRLLVSALAISQRTGSPLEGLLARSARMVERQEELERTLRVKTAQARLSVRIVCIMPVLMVGLLSLASPEFRAGLATPIGLGCVLIAMVLDVTALLIIRRLMKGVI
jgi:tight adherence protein B